jgi:hypothetical protein
MIGQIDTLFQRISYVGRNEDTSCIKLVHFYGNTRSSNAVVEGPKSKEELSRDDEGLGEGGGNATPATDSSGVEDIPSELEANFRSTSFDFSSFSLSPLPSLLACFPQSPFEYSTNLASSHCSP